MTVLPPLPAQPHDGPFIMFPSQWHWLGQAITVLYQSQEILVATIDDLNTQLDAIKASETAEAGSLSSLGTALGTIIADLKALPPVGALTQAQLDAVVQKATDDATAAAANAATGSAQSTQATGAVPPAA